MTHPAKRHVYVLTVWEERRATPGRPAVWRFSLENTHDRRRFGFGSLEELMAFVRAQILHTQNLRGQIRRTDKGNDGDEEVVTD